jgi:predicted DNA-binding WGR domain protein
MIHLQALDIARNIARDYRIEASPDLFGHWIIALHWGRIDARGQNRMVSFAEPEEASRFVRHTLSRRARAKKRIGVAFVNLQIEIYTAGVAIVRIWTNLRLQLAAGIIRRIKASNKGTVKADWP